MIPEITIEDDQYIYYENGNIFSKKLNRNIKTSNKDGYKRVWLNGKKYLLHRVLYEKFIGIIPDKMVVDHINNIRDDNRLENLQLLTYKDNTRKQLKRKDNTSGHTGISKNGNNWQVRIYDNDNKNIRKNFVSLHSSLIYRKYMEIVVLKYPQLIKKGYIKKTT